MVSQTQQRWRASGWGEDQRVGLGLWLACQRLEQTGKTAAVVSGAGVGEGHSCKCGVTTIFWHSLTVDIQYLYAKYRKDKRQSSVRYSGFSLVYIYILYLN